MFGIDAITAGGLLISGVALFVYGIAFGDGSPYRADWTRRK